MRRRPISTRSPSCGAESMAASLALSVLPECAHQGVVREPVEGRRLDRNLFRRVAPARSGPPGILRCASCPGPGAGTSLRRLRTPDMPVDPRPQSHIRERLHICKPRTSRRPRTAMPPPRRRSAGRRRSSHRRPSRPRSTRLDCAAPASSPLLRSPTGDTVRRRTNTGKAPHQSPGILDVLVPQQQ